MQPDTLVRDYLGRLEAAAWPLSEDRRRELVGEVREHIDTALASAGTSDEVTIRNVLDRLGRPEEIVAAEVQTDGTASAPPRAVSVPAPSRWSIGAVEITALLLLTVGAFLLPVVGPILGLVFVWVSTVWSTREKLFATFLVAVLLLLPVVLLFGLTVQPG